LLRDFKGLHPVGWSPFFYLKREQIAKTGTNRKKYVKRITSTMPSKKDKTKIEPGKVFHIFNRGIDKAKIFINVDDYDFFMLKYQQYVAPYVTTYAICLLPNHFHILLRVNPYRNENDSVSEHLRRFFIVIAQRINKKTNRKGGLFCKSFKRLAVEDMNYLKRIVFYIHWNPEKHGIIRDYKLYAFSTYSHIVNNNNCLVDVKEVLYWFGGLESFLEYQDVIHDEIILKKLTMEDD